MRNNQIVQFVSFITSSEPETFLPAWKKYAREEMFPKNEPILLQRQSGSRNKFQYLSRHSWPEGEDCFSFKTSRKQGYFPEFPVQIQHIGGFIPVETVPACFQKENKHRLLVLAEQDDGEPSRPDGQPLVYRCNRYQAFYESCRYAQVTEFFGDSESLETIAGFYRLKPGTEAVLLRDCRILLAKKH